MWGSFLGGPLIGPKCRLPAGRLVVRRRSARPSVFASVCSSAASAHPCICSSVSLRARIHKCLRAWGRARPRCRRAHGREAARGGRRASAHARDRACVHVARRRRSALDPPRSGHGADEGRVCSSGQSAEGRGPRPKPRTRSSGGASSTSSGSASTTAPATWTRRSRPGTPTTAWRRGRASTWPRAGWGASSPPGSRRCAASSPPSPWRRSCRPRSAKAGLG